MTGRIRIGCSGWIYRHWRELFYPPKTPQRLWYGFYADTFETVELNTSFYHLPKPETFTKWRDQAPDGFRYAGKAARALPPPPPPPPPPSPNPSRSGATRHPTASATRSRRRASSPT